MTTHVRRIGGKLFLALDETTLTRLNLAEGDVIEMEVRDGSAVFRKAETDGAARLQRGKAFIDRYRETFEALAK